jgi:hypothetical protein
MFDMYDRTDPRKMPSHLFHGALHLAYATAVRADIAKQDYSVCPRFWYIDAAFACRRCGDGNRWRATARKSAGALPQAEKTD